MRPLAELAIVLGAGLAGPSCVAQTISDYSHAQRALLEAAMAQAAARTAALGAAGAVPAASQASAATARAETPRPVPPPEPVVVVDGVFDSRARALAEVMVDGRLYLLSPGEGVPGTAWRVATIAADRVVLVRPAPGDAARAGRSAAMSKTFALPTLR